MEILRAARPILPRYRWWPRLGPDSPGGVCAGIDRQIHRILPESIHQLPLLTVNAHRDFASRNHPRARQPHITQASREGRSVTARSVCFLTTQRPRAPSGFGGALGGRSAPVACGSPREAAGRRAHYKAARVQEWGHGPIGLRVISVDAPPPPPPPPPPHHTTHMW